MRLQRFKAFRNATRKRDIPCIASFINIVQDAYKGDHTKLVVVEQLLDVSGWLDPHAQKHVHYHHEHLGFKFSLDKNNTPGFMFKTQPALEKHWLGVDGIPNGPPCRALLNIPPAQPRPLRLVWQPEESFLKSVQDCMRFMTKAQQASLRRIADTGDFGVLAHQQILPGAIGQEAIVSVDPLSARLQTIRNFPFQLFSVPAPSISLSELVPDSVKKAAALQVHNACCFIEVFGLHVRCNPSPAS